MEEQHWWDRLENWEDETRGYCGNSEREYNMEYVESERKTEKKKDQTERLIKLDSRYTEDRQILRHA